MATDYKLTPIYRKGKLQRWRKKDKRLKDLLGKSEVWYFNHPKGMTKEQGYRQAWAAWQEVDHQLAALAAPPVHHVKAQVHFSYDPPKPTPDEPPLIYNGREYPSGGTLEEVYSSRTVGVGTDPQAITEAALARLLSHTSSEQTTNTIRQELQDQYQRKMKSAESGGLATKTATRFKDKLQHFVAWIGDGFATADICDQILIDYHDLLQSELTQGKRTKGGCEDQMRAVKHFIRQAKLVSKTLEKLPDLMLVKGQLRFKVSRNNKKVKRRDSANWHECLGDLAKVIDGATDRTKMLILLMLNTGYQQTDISELAQSEIDWTAGTITRVRCKGDRSEYVPEVTYHLWPETLALLKKFAAGEGAPPNRNDEPRLLINHAGKILLNELTDSDNIKESYDRAVKRANVDYKPPASLRKTSSTLLDHSVRLSNHQRNYVKQSDLMLGHAPDTVKGKHYTPEDHAMLSEALSWLRGIYKKAGLF